MKMYIRFYKKVKVITESNPIIRELMYTNAQYGGKITKDKLKEIFGVEYYCMHPFVFERLPTLFFTYHNVKMYIRQAVYFRL